MSAAPDDNDLLRERGVAALVMKAGLVRVDAQLRPWPEQEKKVDHRAKASHGNPIPDSEISDEDYREPVDPGVPPGTPPARPTILITTEEKQVDDEAIAALTNRDEIYQRAGWLVEVIEESSPLLRSTAGVMPMRIRTIPKPKIREFMADAAEWIVERTNKKSGQTFMSPAHPPMWSVSAVESRGDWRDIRHLEALVGTPMLLPDGSVLDEPGYHAPTGLMFVPSVDFGRVDDRPTHAQAVSARDELLEIVTNVPFEKPEHRAAYLAALLTPFARFSFVGPVPMMLVDGNTRGCGKGLTVDTIGILAADRVLERTAYTRDDVELNKLLVSIALAGDSMILFDNVSGVLGSPQLDAALSATFYGGRILGTNQKVPKVLLRSTFFVTGNNLTLAGDTARRTLHIRINTPEVRPELRQGFQHPDLLGWVREHRPRLVRAALTILRAYHVAGRPVVNLPAWGSFNEWSSIVRGAVVWCGLPDPGLTRLQLEEDGDIETIALRNLIDAIELSDPRGVGLTAKEIITLAFGGGNDHEALREAIDDLCPSRDATKAPAPGRLANKMKQFIKRVIEGGRCLDHTTRGGSGVRWYVKSAIKSESGPSL